MTKLLPSEFCAGTTFSRTITSTEFPAPEWSLNLIMRGAGVIDLTSTADDNKHLFSVGSDVTSGWSAGRYSYAIRATDGTDVFPVDDGSIEIIADLSDQVAGFDDRTHVEKTLEAIEAVIQNRATNDQLRYKINNRELERTPLSDLIRLRTMYKQELAALRRAERGSNLFGRPIKVRFV